MLTINVVFVDSHPPRSAAGALIAAQIVAIVVNSIFRVAPKGCSYLPIGRTIVAIVVNQIFLADSAIYLHISCRILRYFHNFLADFAIHSHIFIFFLRMSFIFRNFAAFFARSTIYKFVSARMTQLTNNNFDLFCLIYYNFGSL